MKIMLSGSSGFLGNALRSFLIQKGDVVVPLVRRKQGNEENCILWQPDHEISDLIPFEGFDAVIHLAGENIASGRWTEQKKQRILESRTRGTKVLSTALAKLKNPPKVFICASATGIYGDRGDEICTEKTPSGTGFLSEVCRRWEAACELARDGGIRTVNARFGVVLFPKGGALGAMLPAFKFGLGGVLGAGKQYVSWIAIDDLLEILLFILKNPLLEGPINVASPHPVTNREFTKKLGGVLHRPTLFSIPAYALKLILGKEMAEELLLSSTRAAPLRLIQSDYQFRYPEIEGALKHLLVGD